MIGALGRWLTPKKPEHVAPSPFFERWGERVTARPWVSIAAGVLVLLVFAAPVTQLRLGQPDDGNQPEGKLQRVAYDRLSAAFGAGSNGPFLIAVDIPKGGGGQRGRPRQAPAGGRGTPGMATVAPAAPSEDGEMATIFAIPNTAPQDEATSELLDRLREDDDPEGRRHGTPLKVYIGGNTAGLRGLLGQGRLAPAAVHLGRDRPVRAAADHGLPVALDPARLGRLQPALGRRRLRRRRRASSRRASARACSASTAACRSCRSSR